MDALDALEALEEHDTSPRDMKKRRWCALCCFGQQKHVTKQSSFSAKHVKFSNIGDALPDEEKQEEEEEEEVQEEKEESKEMDFSEKMKQLAKVRKQSRKASRIVPEIVVEEGKSVVLGQHLPRCLHPSFLSPSHCICFVLLMVDLSVWLYLAISV